MSGKRIFTLFIMVFCLVMTGAALAQDTSDSRVDGRAVADEARSDKARDAMDRARSDYREKIAEARERAEELREKKGPELREAREARIKAAQNRRVAVEKREIASEKMEEAQERYEEARNRYNTVSENYDERRRGFAQAKARLQECRESGENCDELEEDTNERAREYLFSVIDRMIAKLEQLIARVEASEALSEEEVDEAVQELRNVTSRLEGLKEQVGEASSKEDLQDIARQAREIWNSSEVDVKKHNYRAEGRRIGLVVNQALLLESRLDCAIDRLNASDEVMAELEASMAEFDSLIESARSEFEGARDAWESGDFESARESLRNGQEFLREAHKASQEVLRNVREAGGSFERCVAETYASSNARIKNSDDDSDYESKKDTKVSVEGDVDLSEDARRTLNKLVSSFEGVEGKFELELEAEREDNETRVEAEVEGNLTSSQQELWGDLQEEIKSLIEGARGDGYLSIEIRNEFQVKEDNYDSQARKGISDGSNDDEAEGDI